ncbi:hypothetical protein DPEC_G00363020 [Dallia pectoralis]|nr:hypothetical protein DPEC_G00363020 [Dallia pectoralis]
MSHQLSGGAVSPRYSSGISSHPAPSVYWPLCGTIKTCGRERNRRIALQSLSLADSRLRSRGTVLVNALGSNTCLRKVDLSGNSLEDAGAKMLSKALQINTTLRRGETESQ